LAARAARFGISTPAAATKAEGESGDPADDDKKKKREARFGAPVSGFPVHIPQLTRGAGREKGQDGRVGGALYILLYECYDLAQHHCQQVGQ
jgi:hypothetical protein